MKREIHPQRRRQANTRVRRGCLPPVDRPSIEPLEPRLFLSASLHNGLLRYYGTSGDDLVEITAGTDLGQVQVNGVEFAGVRKIIIKTGAGDDHVILDHDLRNTRGGFISARIYVEDGNDQVEGGSGRDRIDGGNGDDRLSGGNGNDLIKGARGDDRILGGAGNDRLVGRKGNDTIHGNGGKDLMFGGRGDDMLSGGPGNDRLNGGRDNDQLRGGDGNDIVKGAHGDDTINGGDGENRLLGGPGTDLLYGRPEFDVLRLGRHDRLVEDSGPRLIQRLFSDNEIREWLIERGLEQWDALTGITSFPRQWLGGGAFRFFEDDALAARAADTGADFTDTNVQVRGVDEADLIKTDGKLIYVLSQNELIGIEADPADEMQIAGRVPIDGYAMSMFLHESRLTVLSQVVNSIRPYPIDIIRRPAIGVGAASFAPYKPQLQVTVYDVADGELDDSDLVYETKIDGNLINSRAVDEHVYVVVQNYFNLIQPLYTLDKSTGEVIQETQKEYNKRVRDTEFDEFLPGYTTTILTPEGVQQTTGSLVSAPDIYVPDVPDQTNMTTVVVFDVNGKSGPASTTSVIGTGGHVYSSREYLYIGSAGWWGSWGEGERMAVYQFAIDAANVDLLASGEVEGRVLNQFSMDESHDGFFRIATTSRAGAPENFVFIMERDGDSLDVVGSVDGIGKGETIQSVRFLGDRAYVVTFRVVDPLFSIDLSDPEDPYVTGELKVPGFSTYLHPISKAMLIGFGRDADLVSGRARGLQLSLFDVSDPTDPRLAASHLFPGESHQWSHALNDHHAFSYYPLHDLVALPVVENSWWWDEGTSGLAVLKLDTGEKTSITPITIIKHDSPVLRSLRIDKTLYSFSSGTIKANLMNEPEVEVGEVLLHEDKPKETD